MLLPQSTPAARAAASVAGTASRAPRRQQPRQQARARVLGLALVCVIAGLWWLQAPSVRLWPPGPSRSSPARVVSVWRGRIDDALLAELVEACRQPRSTFVGVQPDSSRAAAPASPPTHCPPAHVPLAPGDRSIGLCTDAALYALLLGAWIVPDALAGLERARACGRSSAVLFVEPLYEPWLDWLAEHRQVVAAYAPNFEHVFDFERHAHARMQLVLCKVRRCEQLMQPYLAGMGSSARLRYTGHTSLDPQAFVHHQQQAAAAATAAAEQQASHADVSLAEPEHLAGLADADAGGAGLAAAAASQPLRALHVRGKSGLKHTAQLLDCWLRHPEWPQLTMVGPLPNEQVNLTVSRAVLASGNIRVPAPGSAAGPGWPAFAPLPAAALAQLLASHALHVVPSEREGFGHSINEGRAAGAVLVVPDHPPMSELVRDGSGVLIAPEEAFSHSDPPAPALARFGNVSASVSAEGICQAVARALKLSGEARLRMGRHARALFEADRAAFEGSMAALQRELAQLLAAAA